MTIQEQFYTVEQFEAFVQQPDNADKLFEFIGGEIVEVPSNPFVSKIAGLILTFFNLYLFDHPIGHITGEAGDYMVSGERYAPDVAFISLKKQPELAKEGYNPNPPDLAVEIISSNRTAERDQLRVKISNYLAVETVVWVVKPEQKQIEVHIHGQSVKIYREQDPIDGGDVLPGFTLTVSRIFA